MHNPQHTFLTNTAQRHYVRVMAFVVLGIVVGALLTYTVFPKKIAEAPIIEQKTASSSEIFGRSLPVTLKIEKIDLETTFEDPLTLQPDQTVNVPKSYEKVGWYQGGVSPGEVGSSVVLGHVDSYTGPAVFYNLGQLVQGDEISIDKADGTTAVFVVERLARYARADFPTQEVYGKTDERTLKLITCSGLFNKGRQEYSHNLVVYARLKD